jgi:molybdopterin-guanine dinucleotide biosynthesis protein
MSEDSRLKIISVTGAHSGVGKTTLCAFLLNEFEGFGAIKFTKTTLFSSLVDDEAELKHEGKDTAIMYGAGAEKVLWIKSPTDGLEHVLEIALERMRSLKGVVVEGNSPVDFLNPHLLIFIVGEDGEIKPSALNVAGRADVLVYNSDKGAGHLNLPFATKKAVKVFSINLTEKSGESDDFIAYLKERIA